MPTADNPIEFELVGPGTILGTAASLTEAFTQIAEDREAVADDAGFDRFAEGGKLGKIILEP